MLNCTQVEELLPLYVSRDLEATREPLLATHLESCAACSVAAVEYRQTRQLIQEFAPPAFSEDLYAGIRQNVWRQLESESTTSSRWDAVIDLFRPRLAWAFAAVALLAVSVFGLYLFANRSSVPERIAAFTPAASPNVANRDLAPSPEEGTRVQPVKPAEVPKKQLLTGRRPPLRRTQRNATNDSADAVVVARSTPSLTSDTSSGVNLDTQSDASSDRNSEKLLRMELQTRNPNIRIIWFSQREPKHASSNSKGI